MIDQILLWLILIVAAWIWLFLEVRDAFLFIVAFLILNPWIAFICIGLGSLTLLMERAAARRKASR